MKKKILALCLVVVLAVTAVTGATLAYFTDTDDATNTFTVGNVRIDLTEAVVKVNEDPTSEFYGDLVAVNAEKNRNDVEGGDKETYDYGKLFPGQNVYKDPRIENLGTEDAYVAAKITITSAGDLHSILGVSEEYDNIDISKIVSGGITGNEKQNANWNGLMVYENDKYAVYQEPNKEKNTYVLYFFVKDALANLETVTLFDTLSIPSAWNNDEMAQLKGLTIKVEAFAVQEYGFADCYSAIMAAFGNKDNENPANNGPFAACN